MGLNSPVASGLHKLVYREIIVQLYDLPDKLLLLHAQAKSNFFSIVYLVKFQEN